MNGPLLVCAACQKPTSLFKPVCDECMAAIESTFPPESLVKFDEMVKAREKANREATE